MNDGWNKFTRVADAVDLRGMEDRVLESEEYWKLYARVVNQEFKDQNFGRVGRTPTKEQIRFHREEGARVARQILQDMVRAGLRRR